MLSKPLLIHLTVIFVVQYLRVPLRQNNLTNFFHESVPISYNLKKNLCTDIKTTGTKKLENFNINVDLLQFLSFRIFVKKWLQSCIAMRWTLEYGKNFFYFNSKLNCIVDSFLSLKLPFQASSAPAKPLPTAHTGHRSRC
jgi:hypothetical protein